MSHCGNFLEHYRQVHALKQFELADRLKLSTSHLSHILNAKASGRVKGIEPATLGKILEALEDKDRMQFMQCYLRDVVEKKFHPFIPAGVATGTIEEPAAYRADAATTELVRAIHESDAPARITKLLKNLVKKSKGKPQYLTALAKIAEI